MSDSKRDIAADRAMCEFLKIDRWLSVEARAEYGYGAWIDVNLTHGDDMGVAEDDIFTVAKALPHYLARCEHLERMVDAAFDALTKPWMPCPREVQCPQPNVCVESEETCRQCWSDYLDQKAKEGAK